MDSLKSLTTHVPGWIERLDELSGKIEQRQTQLASLEAASSSSPSPSSSAANSPRPAHARSLRNKGSTESLRPPKEQPDEAEQEHVMPPPLTAVRRIQRKRRTESLASLDGDNNDKNNKPKKQSRTRTIIIVYYDSYVQTFFEELVKFVSAQRNMMRKAKMAAKVAHIKRMAELEMPSSDGDEADDHKSIDFSKRFAPQPAADRTADAMEVDDKIEVGDAAAGAAAGSALAYPSAAAVLASSRAFASYANYTGPHTGPHTGYLQRLRAPPDIYDALDKNLEFVQSVSEQAAHQFLRDGDCNDEIGRIRQRLAETREQAQRELARVARDDPDALAAAEAPVRSRSFRPQTMRRAEAKPRARKGKPVKMEPAARPDEDEGIEVDACAVEAGK